MFWGLWDTEKKDGAGDWIRAPLGNALTYPNYDEAVHAAKVLEGAKFRDGDRVKYKGRVSAIPAEVVGRFPRHDKVMYTIRFQSGNKRTVNEEEIIKEEG